MDDLAAARLRQVQHVRGGVRGTAGFAVRHIYVRIVGCEEFARRIWGRGCAENILVRRETRPLVALKHAVGKTIVRGNEEIRGDIGPPHIFELRVGRTCRRRSAARQGPPHPSCHYGTWLRMRHACGEDRRHSPGESASAGSSSPSSSPLYRRYRPRAAGQANHGRDYPASGSPAKYDDDMLYSGNVRDRPASLQQEGGRDNGSKLG